MWLRSKEDSVHAMHDEALSLLDAGDLAGAKRVASELRAMGWSGAFEVLALALRAEKDLAGAVRALEEGCVLAPEAWALHELRGSMLDALGETARALAAYDGALSCEGAWTASVHYNRAITRLKAGDAGGALADAEAALGGASPPPFAIDAIGVAIDALDRLRRNDDAVSLVRTALSEADGGVVAPRLTALLAVALDRSGKRAEARDAAVAAIEAGHGSAALARLVDPPTLGAGAAAYRFHLLVAGAWPSEPRASGFYRSVWARAADTHEALAWARLLEPAAIGATLCIEEVLATDDAHADDIRGVLSASGRVLF
jgi:tetratricopeptide (TPR) repeat protein